MVKYIRQKLLFEEIPILTDCDPEFFEFFGLEPSMNTIENAHNAVTVVNAGRFNKVIVVAEQIHLPRVVGTLREQLTRLMQHRPRAITLEEVPTDGKFEWSNDQWHLRSEWRFRMWNVLAERHHRATGNMIDKE